MIMPMQPMKSLDLEVYHNQQQTVDRIICDQLAGIISSVLTEAEGKLWHAHPVWFLDGNPIVGYSRQKAGIRLMFWSGADFNEPGLNVPGKKFKDASIFYQQTSDIDEDDLTRWLQKAREVQWDYKNIVKRKGVLVKLER